MTYIFIGVPSGCQYLCIALTSRTETTFWNIALPSAWTAIHFFNMWLTTFTADQTGIEVTSTDSYVEVGITTFFGP